MACCQLTRPMNAVLPMTAFFIFLCICITIITLNHSFRLIDQSEYLVQNEISNNSTNIRIHMISYGDHKWRSGKNRIYKQALNTDWFDTIEVLGPHNLTTDFKQTFRDILNFSRGGG
eukprot:207180_1